MYKSTIFYMAMIFLSLFIILFLALYLTSSLVGLGGSSGTSFEWTWNPEENMKIVFKTGKGIAIFFGICFLEVAILKIICSLSPFKNWRLEQN